MITPSVGVLKLTPLVTLIFSFFSGVPFLTTLILLLFLDIATGFMAGYATKRISSNVTFKGMLKKWAVLMAACLAAIIQPLLPQIPCLSITCCFLCTHETLSVVENLAMLGVPFPPQLLDALKKFKQSNDNGNPEPLIIKETIRETTLIDRPLKNGVVSDSKHATQKGEEVEHS